MRAPHRSGRSSLLGLGSGFDLLGGGSLRQHDGLGLFGLSLEHQNTKGSATDELRLVLVHKQEQAQTQFCLSAEESCLSAEATTTSGELSHLGLDFLGSLSRRFTLLTAFSLTGQQKMSPGGKSCTC